MIPWVRYYYMQPGTVMDRNSGIAVVFGSWPKGALKSRGWTPDHMVCQRLATEEEQEWLEECMRHQAYLYPDLDGLLVDEAKVLEPPVMERIRIALKEACNESERVLECSAPSRPRQ